ncbi:MAG TPA: hypothetical protein VGQ63_03945 [Pseudolabrys sp.]|nr:hypothetical protein [Pseudolabrys sp.]
MKIPLILSELAKSWAANAKARFNAIRQSGELEREKQWEAEQKRRRASLDRGANVGMDEPG